MEFRCPFNKFGEVVNPGVGGVVEFKCRSRWCGYNGGRNVVIHKFEVDTQKLIDTRIFKNPEYRQLNRSTTEKGTGQ